MFYLEYLLDFRVFLRMLKLIDVECNEDIFYLVMWINVNII